MKNYLPKCFILFVVSSIIFTSCSNEESDLPPSKVLIQKYSLPNNETLFLTVDLENKQFIDDEDFQKYNRFIESTEGNVNFIVLSETEFRIITEPFEEKEKNVEKLNQTAQVLFHENSNYSGLRSVFRLDSQQNVYSNIITLNMQCEYNSTGNNQGCNVNLLGKISSVEIYGLAKTSISYRYNASPTSTRPLPRRGNYIFINETLSVGSFKRFNLENIYISYHVGHNTVTRTLDDFIFSVDNVSLVGN